MSDSVVDWSFAERTAATLTPEPASEEGSYGATEVEAACAEAIATAAGYARMAVPASFPTAEVVDRRSWSRAALGTLREASLPLERRLDEAATLPAPFGKVARRLIGLGIGAEAGVAVGFAARRVLGQYDLALVGPERPARLLFVGPNLDRARGDLGADHELFLRWVALHETTHVLQFANVAWLASHLRELAGRLLDDAAGGIDGGQLGALLKRALRDPREVARLLLRGELAQALARPETRGTLARLQATMSVVEGHAEHVMDACVADDPRLGELRERMAERRRSRGGLAAIAGRLLGFDLKLRQYELGKRFWDAVVAERGELALDQVWRSPEGLPDLGELEEPARWLRRTRNLAIA